MLQNTSSFIIVIIEWNMSSIEQYISGAAHVWLTSSTMIQAK